MRSACLPHAARRSAACALLALGALVLQGCGEDPAPADPYAELDARYPGGRPGIVDAQTRAKDAAYLSEIQRLGQARVAAEEAAARAEEAVARFRADYARSVSKRLGKEAPADYLEAALAHHAHFQSLLKAAEEARVAAEEAREAVAAAIRDKQDSARRAYDGLRAEADRAAVAAGLKIRAARRAPEAKAEAEATQEAAAGKPTLPAGAVPFAEPEAKPAPADAQELSEATGIPVAPNGR